MAAWIKLLFGTGATLDQDCFVLEGVWVPQNKSTLFHKLNPNCGLSHFLALCHNTGLWDYYQPPAIGS